MIKLWCVPIGAHLCVFAREDFFSMKAKHLCLYTHKSGALMTLC